MKIETKFDVGDRVVALNMNYKDGWVAVYSGTVTNINLSNGAVSYMVHGRAFDEENLFPVRGAEEQTAQRVVDAIGQINLHQEQQK